MLSIFYYFNNVLVNAIPSFKPKKFKTVSFIFTNKLRAGKVK